MAKQLQMRWPFLKTADSLKWELPAGYRLRNFENGDADAYIFLMQAAGFHTWGQNQLNSVFENAIADGIYFVEYLKTREIVATCSGQAKPTAEFPAGGELGWVACHPFHRGKGLGYAVCAVLTKRFLELSYSQIYLSTDDFRLPAI
ncbi:GNAT family N-acetyltransferase, partial [bacterium]|nr:GNAT family N-acetyltransferase [bacterium]